LQKELGVTTIFVTHDQEEAMTTADRMAVLDKGILQQVGSAETLFDYPVNKFVAGFVGTTNFLDGHLTQVNADGIHFDVNGIGSIIIPQSKESISPGPYALSFRPHVVHLQATGELSPDKVWFSGVIESSEFLGESSRYRVKVGEHVIIANQTHFAGLSRFSAGLKVQLGIDPSQIRFLNS
jgi:iron(III) transport system ATP-binding protein